MFFFFIFSHLVHLSCAILCHNLLFYINVYVCSFNKITFHSLLQYTLQFMNEKKERKKMIFIKTVGLFFFYIWISFTINPHTKYHLNRIVNSCKYRSQNYYERLTQYSFLIDSHTHACTHARTNNRNWNQLMWISICGEKKISCFPSFWAFHSLKRSTENIWYSLDHFYLFG